MKKIFYFLIFLLSLKFIYSQSLFNYPIIPTPASYFNLISIDSLINFQNISSSDFLNFFPSLFILEDLGANLIVYIPSDNYLQYNVYLNQPEYLYIYSNFSTPVNIYITNSTQYLTYPENISSLYNFTSSYLYTSVYLNPGNYYIIISNNNSYPVYGFFYYYNSTEQNYPMFLPYGISDSGIAILNNTIYVYSYNTTEFIGEIYINNLQLSNSYCNTNSISFQLNVPLVIANNQSSIIYAYNTQSYFLQNVLELNLSSDNYFFADNIWNVTSNSTGISQNNIIGEGSVVKYENQTVYGYVYNKFYNLTFPLEVYLIINITKNNSYPEIQFGYSFDGENIIWYDNVTLEVQNYESSIFISPSALAFYSLGSAGLAIGGPGFGSCSYINNANLTLSLYFLYNYDNITAFSPVEFFFNYYLFTGETSSNIYPVQNGYSLTYYSGQPYLGFFSYINNNSFEMYNVTIEYPNGTILNYQYPEGYEINITFPQYINLSNYSIENLSSIIINGQVYYYNSINITVNTNLTIIPNYTLEYLVNISSPFQFLVNNVSYENFTNWIENGTELYIKWNNTNYINQYERYYCNNNNEQLLINEPIYLNLSNFCNLQYFVEINTDFPVNVSINGNYINVNGTYSNYINNGTLIYIEPEKYVFSSFFSYEIYYYNGSEYLINSTNIINVEFNKNYGYNYLNIGLVSAIIVIIIIFILW